MTSMTVTRTVARPAPTLNCQRVGGCSARVTVTAIVVVALLVAASLLCVWSRIEVVRQGYALSDTAAQIGELAADQERLRAEAASLRSTERIESLARGSLGMQFPNREQIRVVEIRTDEPGLFLARGPESR